MNNVLTNSVQSQSEPAAARWLFRLLSQLHCGSIELRCPDGTNLSFAGKNPGPHAALTLHGF